MGHKGSDRHENSDTVVLDGQTCRGGDNPAPLGSASRAADRAAAHAEVRAPDEEAKLAAATTPAAAPLKNESYAMGGTLCYGRMESK
jgi:hypothetical protein